MIKRISSYLKSKICSPINYARSIGVNVGANCEFQRNIDWGSEPYLIKIGNNVRVTRGCKFITHDGGIWVLRNLKMLENADVFGKIIIGNNVHIGFDSIIMPGVKIGNNCIVGCGAVVTHDIPDNTIVGGVPARKIKDIDEYYEKQRKICDFTKNLSGQEKKIYLKKKYNQMES